MLSGVGNATTLKTLGVPVLVDNPDVGQHLQDHPIVSSFWTVASNSTIDDISRDPSIGEADLLQWEANRTGLFADTVLNTVGFVRLPESLPVFATYGDPSAGTLYIAWRCRCLFLP